MGGAEGGLRYWIATKTLPRGAFAAVRSRFYYVCPEGSPGIPPKPKYKETTNQYHV